MMTTKKRKSQTKRWSHRVTETSNALDLEKNVFAQEDPRRIARSLKRSAEKKEQSLSFGNVYAYVLH